MECPADESPSEQSGQEDIQLMCASQSQRLLILTGMVRNVFKLPLAEVTEPPFGIPKASSGHTGFPLTPTVGTGGVC